MGSIRSFIELLTRFLSGRATPKDEEIIEKWYSALDEDNNFPNLTTEEADALHAEDYETLRRWIKRPSRLRILWPSLAAAAAIVIAIFFFYKEHEDRSGAQAIASTKESHTPWLQAGDSVLNSTNGDVEVWLADSSSVTLKPKSTLTVARNFNESGRHVTLQGEGYFKIKRNEHRPFRVFTYGVVTQVLGTSFIVHAPSEHERIAVQVKTGKVAVRRRQDDTGVVLTPNQQVTFDPAKKRLAPSLVEKPVLLIGADKTREVYDDVGIDRVLADISQAYGIDIIASEKIRSKRITTAFVDEGLYDRLDILTRAIGARYRVDGTQIRIESQEH